MSDTILPGVEYSTGMINNVRYHMTIVDMAGKRAEVTWLDGNMETLSRIAKRKGAILGWNADDYQKASAPPYYPTSLTVSNGVKKVDQVEQRYFLNISRANVLKFSNADKTSLWNTTSFVRTSVVNGIMASHLSDMTRIENKEYHARTAHGIHKDGRLMALVVEGKYLLGTGCTLPQMSDLLIQHGALWAGEHGGGGDSGMWLIDRIISEPSDPYERPTVQQLLIYSEETMAKYTVELDKTDMALRPNHNTDNDSYFYIPKGTILPSDTMFVAAQQLSNASGVYQYARDKWMQVTYNGQTGWMAYIHKGAAFCKVTENIQPSPEPAPLPEVAISIDGGAEYVIDVTGAGTSVVSLKLKPKP